MPLPIAHGLLGASIVVAGRRNFSLADDWKVLLAGATLAIIPDADLVPLVFHVRGTHRTATHSLLLALLFGVVYILARGWQCREQVGIFTLALASHGVLDYLTTEHGGGVELFWPLSTQRYKLGLFAFSDFAGGITLIGVLGWALIEMVVFGALLATVLLFRRHRTPHI